MRHWERIGLIAILLGGIACGDDEGDDAGVADAGIDAGVDAGADAGVDTGVDAGAMDAGEPDAGEGDAGFLTVRVTHTATTPLVESSGGVAYVDDDLAVASTLTGIIAFHTRGPNAGGTPAGFTEWTLTSTGTGGAAAPFLAAAPPGAFTEGRFVFFNPAGRPQVGALIVGEAGAQGDLLAESVLAADLSSEFPADVVTSREGPASDALWVVDVSFGAPNAVRAYPFASWDAASRMLSEDETRSFMPPAEDFDGDQVDDPIILGSLRFAEGGRVGLVAFTFLALGGSSGGVYAFDTATGDMLGRIVVPFESDVAAAFEFVGGVDANGDHLVVSVAQKGPMFEDIGGRAAIYRVIDWQTFDVEDADPAALHDDPASWIETTEPNAIGVLVTGDLALVVSAPFFMDATLDAISISDAAIIRAEAIGSLFVNGFNVPSGPWLSPDGRVVLIGTEAGVLRADLVER